MTDRLSLSDALEAFFARDAENLPSTAITRVATDCLRDVEGEAVRVCTEDVSDGFRARVGVTSSFPIGLADLRA
jgi:hypothetical protein